MKSDALHPFVAGLIQTLPESDTVFLYENRRAWLQAAADIFDLLYTVRVSLTDEEAEPEKIVVMHASAKARAGRFKRFCGIS